MKDIISKLAVLNIKNLNDVGVNEAGGEQNLGTTISNIVTAVVGILGLACVIIIIIGGINYMTSAGDAGKVKKAKDTILYGVIGMIICVLAFAITQFIITGINGSSA